MSHDQTALDTKAIGLDLGLRLGRFFLESDDLHYGYWPPDLEVKAANFPRAQELYSQFVRSHFPEGVHTILDVGSGSGHFAESLVAEGFQVDCVSPSSYLSEQIEERLPAESQVFRTTFEALETRKRYDLILFCESFQYVSCRQAIEKCSALLRPKGYLLICDFFKKDVGVKSPLGGGQKLATFLKVMETAPFVKEKEIDITEETAPTMDILDQFLTEVADPIRKVTGQYLDARYPRLMKLLKWKFAKRIDKLNRIYFSGQLTREMFKKFKLYQLVLYRLPE